MRLLTTQEFSEILDYAYVHRGYGMTLGDTIYQAARIQSNHNLKELLTHARESGDYLITWENEIAVIKYFIDNFVEEF